MVYRIPQTSPIQHILFKLRELDIDIILFAKWENMPPLKEFERRGIKTVCWLFDLYWGYARENRLKDAPYFRAQHVFTTDGGHDHLFRERGINHACIRQGIYGPDCKLLPAEDPKGIAFVGSDNTANTERVTAISFIQHEYPDSFTWVGRSDTNEMRGAALNALYARTKIVVGDSVWSQHYWSNRVVETLGRGGFLIHVEVPGLSTCYPHLVTYRRGDMRDLKAKIDYYLSHEKERREIVRKNFEQVKQHYTMQHMCHILLGKVCAISS